MPPSTSIQRWPVYAVGLVALAVAAVAVPSAVSWYGQPIPGVLVGPNAVVSGVGRADWDGPRQGLRFPDRIVAAEGTELSELAQAEPSRRLALLAGQALARGRTHLNVTVEQGRCRRSLSLGIERLDPATWWLVAGSLFFSGALYIAAGMIALWVNPTARLSRTFGALAPLTGLFMFATFDYHTSCRLVPVFYLTFALIPGKMCMLALRLPDDAPLLRRLPWLERATTAAGLVVGGSLLAAYCAGVSTVPLQVVWTSVFGASALFFVAVFVARFALAQGRRRSTLRALLVSMVPPHVVVGGLMALRPLTQWTAYGDTLAYPALAVTPVSTAYAFVRYDLWGSRTLLSRILTKIVIGTVVCALAVAAAAGLGTRLGMPLPVALLSAAVSGIGAALLLLLVLQACDRRLFPSRAQYKPTVEHLSEELTSLTSPAEVSRAIERTVRRWLPCDQIRLVLDTPEGAAALEPLRSGFLRRSAREPPAQHIAPIAAELSLPVRFGDRQLGVLQLGAKPGGALFTSDDMDLLSTITNQGALALAHAHAYQELEQRRRQQAAAWRGEREALVETVAAEIAHEIRYPLNYFRSLFERAGGRALDSEDVDIGREEVARLERLVGGLRRMTVHRLERCAIGVRVLCERAEVLLRDALQGRELLLDGDPELVIRCDADQATQVLVNLLANAVEATDPSQQLGVEWGRSPGGAQMTVWDRGPGFVGDPSALFAPWYTTKERGTGLGLAITHRLVRAHGWSIEASRELGRTLFTITIQDADVVQSKKPAARQDPGEVA